MTNVCIVGAGCSHSTCRTSSTPHVAWSGRQAMQALADQLMDNVEAFVRGAPRNVC
jgi:lactate dehydrogenase-like 2-hydroxyacid dehydrogenase